jgi:diacylglycerol kinase (ATP)
LSEAAEGFFEFKQDVTEPPSPVNTSAALAILPAGTGDDFARGLTNGKRATLEHWTNIFIAHCQQPDNDHARLIDVLYGVCNGYSHPFICLNASTMGIGGETATRVAAQGRFMRRLSGEMRFAAAAFVSIAHWRERRVRVSVDDEMLMDGPMNLAAVANALYAGGGMMLSPAARFDDGKLDAVTASGLNRVAVLRELGRIHKGGHVANPKVKIAQGTKANIETFVTEDAMPIEVDGNVRGVTPVEFRVLPKALRFVV